MLQQTNNNTWVRAFAGAVICAAIAGCGSKSSDDTGAKSAKSATTPASPAMNPGAPKPLTASEKAQWDKAHPDPPSGPVPPSIESAPAVAKAQADLLQARSSLAFAAKAAKHAPPPLAKPFQPSPLAKPLHLPANVIAKVGDHVITKAMLDREFAKRQKYLIIPSDAPKYAKCIATLAKRMGMGEQAPDSEVPGLRQQCAQQHAEQVTAAMTRVLGEAQDAEAVKHRTSAGLPQFSEARIKEFYNNSHFSLSAERDVQVMTAKSKSAAEALKRKLAKSKPVKTYSTIQIEQPYELGKLIFGLAKGAIGGPIKVDDNWQIVRVLGIRPPTRKPTLARMHDEILSSLQTHDVGTEARTEAWKTAATTCGAGYVIALCSNADTRSDAEVRASKKKYAEQLAKFKQQAKAAVRASTERLEQAVKREKAKQGEELAK